jgi:uncharacterized membrane protein
MFSTRDVLSRHTFLFSEAQDEAEKQVAADEKGDPDQQRDDVEELVDIRRVRRRLGKEGVENHIVRLLSLRE